MSETVSGERFLGGISGARLIRAGKTRQYGIFATDRRLFGVRDMRIGGYFRSTIVTSPRGGGGTFSNLSINKTQSMLEKVEEDNEAIISKLEKENDFVLPKNQIRSIELEKPGFISNGLMFIRTLEDKPIKIRIHGKEEFGLLSILMKEFYPEILKGEEKS